MRLLDRTYVTEDEGWNIAYQMAEQLRLALETLGELDSYNNQYVLHFTLDRIDEPLKEKETSHG